MRPSRGADSSRASNGCPGSSTTPTVAGTSAQPLLPGKRTGRSDCLSGEFFGVGRETASLSERTHCPSPRNLGPAGRKICRQSGTPAPPSPRSNKAKAPFSCRCGTSQDSSTIPRRPRTASRIPEFGVPRRKILVLNRNNNRNLIDCRHAVRDGGRNFTLPGLDARTKSAPWPDRRN